MTRKLTCIAKVVVLMPNPTRGSTQPMDNSGLTRGWRCGEETGNTLHSVYDLHLTSLSVLYRRCVNGRYNYMTLCIHLNMPRFALTACCFRLL